LRENFQYPPLSGKLMNNETKPERAWRNGRGEIENRQKREGRRKKKDNKKVANILLSRRIL
jgi:hypothetical protein